MPDRHTSPDVLTLRAKVPGVSVLVCDSDNWAKVQDAEMLVMGEQESARVARLRDPAARQALLSSLASARMLLARALGLPAGAVRLSRTESGAPVLPDAPGRAVSISRSRGWTAVALGDARALGVDVETVRPIDWRAMLAMTCSDAERDSMLALPDDQAPSRFLELWTVKEAVLKATGQGLRGGAKRVPVQVALLGQPEPTEQAVRVDTARYTVWTERVGDVLVSVAVGEAR